MSILKKMKRAKAKEQKKCLDRATNIGNKAHRKLSLIDNALAMYFTAIANISCFYTLRKEMKMTRKEVDRFAMRYKGRNDCVASGHVKSRDIVIHEISGTDKEYSPLKWTDYENKPVEVKDILAQMPAATEGEILDNCYRAGVVRRAEKAFLELEITMLSALHDECGYGLVRCKRFSEAYRNKLFKDERFIFEMIDFTVKDGFFQNDNKNIKRIKEAVDTWKYGLKYDIKDYFIHPEQLEIKAA